MTARLHARRVYNGAKTAFRLLVDRCGGPNSAERISRVSQTQISRYGDLSEEHASYFAPLDVVLDLESHCDAPIVSEYLAETAGYVLVPMPKAKTPDSATLVARVSDMLREVSDVSGGVAEALADDRITRAEAKALHREVREAMQKLAELDRDIGRAAEARPIFHEDQNEEGEE